MDASLYFTGGIHFVFFDPFVVVIVNIFFYCYYKSIKWWIFFFKTIIYFCFQSTKKGFHHRVIIIISFSRHRLNTTSRNTRAAVHTARSCSVYPTSIRRGSAAIIGQMRIHRFARICWKMCAANIRCMLMCDRVKNCVKINISWI